MRSILISYLHNINLENLFFRRSKLDSLLYHHLIRKFYLNMFFFDNLMMRFNRIVDDISIFLRFQKRLCVVIHNFTTKETGMNMNSVDYDFWSISNKLIYNNSKQKTRYLDNIDDKNWSNPIRDLLVQIRSLYISISGLQIYNWKLDDGLKKKKKQ